jgi:hypothetical protein
MKQKNKIISAFFLLTFALFNSACQKQQVEPGNTQQQQQPAANRQGAIAD